MYNIDIGVNPSFISFSLVSSKIYSSIAAAVYTQCVVPLSSCMHKVYEMFPKSTNCVSLVFFSILCKIERYEADRRLGFTLGFTPNIFYMKLSILHILITRLEDGSSSIFSYNGCARCEEVATSYGLSVCWQTVGNWYAFNRLFLSYFLFIICGEGSAIVLCTRWSHVGNLLTDKTDHDPFKLN